MMNGPPPRQPAGYKPMVSPPPPPKRFVPGEQEAVVNHDYDDDDSGSVLMGFVAGLFCGIFG